MYRVKNVFVMGWFMFSICRLEDILSIERAYLCLALFFDFVLCICIVIGVMKQAIAFHIYVRSLLTLYYGGVFMGVVLNRNG